MNRYQHSKKVVSEIPGLEDFAIRLVRTTVFNLLMGREVLLGIQITEEFAINPAHKNVFWGG